MSKDTFAEIRRMIESGRAVSAEIEQRKRLEAEAAQIPVPADLQEVLDKLNAEAAQRARNIEAGDHQLASAGIPKRFDGLRMSALSRVDGNKDALDAARAFILGSSAHLSTGRGLFLSGGVGSGKTALAVVVLRGVVRLNSVEPTTYSYRPKIIMGSSGLEISDEWELIVTGGKLLKPLNPLFINTAVWLDVQRSEFAKPPTSRRDPADKSARIVLIDDIGAERGTEWERERLYTLVNDLYERCVSVIVTSNASIDALADTAGARVADRLREMCAVRVLKNKSWRG